MTTGNIQEHEIDEKKLFRDLNDEDAADVARQCEARRGHVLRVKRRKLAIIFVPGIMASRLENNSGGMVWDPDSPVTSMLKFLFAGPARRQALLLPDPPLSVPQKNNKADRGDVPKRFPHAMERGWHTVSWTYYGKLLESLADWATPLKAFIDMRVYAFGYDWLRSNNVSGKELCDTINALQEDKIIIVSHSMGGLVTRACVIRLKDKNRVLGVIHGAQPAMGAPAAYRRQKAGFEAHSFAERLVSLALGKDGPNVRAIFPYRSGPLELLPCRQYYDPELKDGTWFFYDTFENGLIVSKSIPSADIYAEVYAKFEDEYYYGMLNRGEFYRGIDFLCKKNTSNYDFHNETNTLNNNYNFPDLSEETQYKSEDDILNNIKRISSFHDKLNKNPIHPRTIQLFSRGKPTCCAVHWKAEDFTDKIINHDFDPKRNNLTMLAGENIRTIIPSPLDGGNDYYELRWIEKNGKVGECILTSRRGGRFIGGKTIQKQIRESGRHVALFTLTKPTQDGRPDRENTHWDNDGDGTVPVASVLALPVSTDGWPETLKDKLPSYCREDRNGTSGDEKEAEGKDDIRHVNRTAKQDGKTYGATKLTSNAEHSGFFDDNAIRATKQAIHNLCVAWLKGDIA